ncbi:MAG: hypothetical protein H6726_02435 [Sandaracinaceae bacterium]|nr:hypothetical protein [Myxococcales bacterium]MCB9656480.1 hypothetical protein [Sandaracinaceae bacterium]
MKTAVSIPDAILLEAEQVAKRLGLSRSELFTRAVEAYLAEQEHRGVTESYDVAFGEVPERDDAQRSVARRALLTVEWDNE